MVTASKCIRLNALHCLRNMNLFQATAMLEGSISNRRQPVWKLDLFQALAASKCLHSDLLYTLWQNNIGKALTFTKYNPTNFFDLCINPNRC